MTTVWRINIKTAARDGIDPRRFCLDASILGVGWPVDAVGQVDWDMYYRLAEACYYNRKDRDNGWWPAVNAIKNRMQVDDLCWTRDSRGIYYLGRIASDWRYCNEKKYRNADVVNVRTCEWVEVGALDAVPGRVVNSFRNRAVQAVNDENVVFYSKYLYNKRSRRRHYELAPRALNLFSLISYDDCEDLVGFFLQDRGYRIVPSSCKADTPVYEFVLKHSKSGKTAVAQVKQGNVDLNIAEYKTIPDEVYLFTTGGSYLGAKSRKVHCISPGEIERFALSHYRVLPDRLKVWIDIVRECGSG